MRKSDYLFLVSLVVLVSFVLDHNFLTLSTYRNLATIICAPAAPQILKDFHSTNALDATILVSIWELGEIVGPLLIAPLSELYGRLVIYHIANVLFILCSISGALSTSINMLIVFRFLNGMTVACTTLNAGTVVDMFRQDQRGAAMALMGFSPLIGVICGPIFGGYLSAALSWRWTFWLISIVAGFLELCFLLFFRETYKFTILQWKAKRLRHETGNMALRSRYDDDGKSPRQIFQNAIFRPAKILIFSPVVLILSLYSAVISGYLYLVLTTMTEVFEKTYGFTQGPVGLTFLGIGMTPFSWVPTIVRIFAPLTYVLLT